MRLKMKNLIQKIQKAFVTAAIYSNPQIGKQVYQLQNSPSLFIDGRLHTEVQNIPIVLKPYQKYILDTIHKNRLTIFKMPRQSSKSFLGMSYALHYALFNSNVSVAIVEHKGKYSNQRISTWVKQLPLWCRPEIPVKNSSYVNFDNGSCIYFYDQNEFLRLKGYHNLNLVILDEFGYYNSEVASQYVNEACNKNTNQLIKVAILSTPSPDTAHPFNKLYESANEGLNDFVPISINWKECIGERDNQWKKEMVNYIGEEAFKKEYDNQ